MIAKGERTELKSIVRQQFKVLRAEVLQRQAELEAEAEQRIVARYRDVDDKREALTWKIAGVLETASREITDLLQGSNAVHGTERRYGWDDDEPVEVSVERPVELHFPTIHWRTEDRVQLRRALVTAIHAEIKGALLQLDRQEADLLRTLAVGALESEEAHKFLTSIPSVAELVPAARLKELEAQFADGEKS